MGANKENKEEDIEHRKKSKKKNFIDDIYNKNQLFETYNGKKIIDRSINQISNDLLNYVENQFEKQVSSPSSNNNDNDDDNSDNDKKRNDNRSAQSNKIRVIGDETNPATIESPSTKPNTTITSAVVMEDSFWFRSLLRAVRWQRDNYLVDNHYANKRKVERKEQEDEQNRQEKNTYQYYDNYLFYRIPYHSTATSYSYIHLTNISSWFIPSDAVKDSLMPIVLNLPQKNQGRGSIYDITKTSTINLISSQQTNLDFIIKHRLLEFLKDDDYRELIKKSMKGHISNTYRDM